jgi:hypothetical protein
MIQIKPVPSRTDLCECGGELKYSEYLWQGLHICKKSICVNCSKTVIVSLPVNQSEIEQYRYFPETGIIKNKDYKTVKKNWFTEKLTAISKPSEETVEIEISIFKKSEHVIILNTLDYVYGHSLLFLLNLQHIIKNNKDLGIIVIVQPMLKWLIPVKYVTEIWTVKLEFRKLVNFYPDLSSKINLEINRFHNVFLSSGHVIPTNENINIEDFTGISPYDFSNQPSLPKITFIWREDPDRLWIRNFYLLKGCKKLGISKILLPFHYLRVLRIFRLLKKRLNKEYEFTITGLGKFGRFPSYIDDQRIPIFNEESEKKLCQLYSQSVLVFGVHGSSMLLPSAHAGMTISLMPSKRWGNFAEDILFTENDPRLATFQRRVLPLNISVPEIRDIVSEMITGRDYFIKKFLHSDEL